MMSSPDSLSFSPTVLTVFLHVINRFENFRPNAVSHFLFEDQEIPVVDIYAVEDAILSRDSKSHYPSETNSKRDYLISRN